MRRWMTVLLGGVSALIAGVLASGCGGGDETETGDPTPTYKYPTEDSFCAAVAKAECSATVVKACYGSDDTTLEDDTLSCVSARTTRCNPDHLPYHPERAEACVSARGAAIGDAVWSHDDLAAVEKACLPVFSKMQTEGAVCSESTDCDATLDLRCVVKLGSLQGVCATPVEVLGGESCADPAEVCADGFYCDPKVSHCLANPGENEDCSAGAPCGEGFYCTDADAGKCAAKTKNGLDCDRDEVCAGGFCVGATADVMGKCSATLPLQITATSCDAYRQ